MADWLKRSIDGEKDKLKTIIFSEYVDTVLHLEPYFREVFGSRVLVCDGNISKELSIELDANFNAQFKGKKRINMMY